VSQVSTLKLADSSIHMPSNGFVFPGGSLALFAVCEVG